MSHPEDPPTEPLRPRAPLHPADAGVPVAATVDPAWTAQLEDQIRSLKGLAALLTVLTLAALGLAAWAIIRDDDTEAGPSQARVARIDEKVDRLEQRVGGDTAAAKAAPSTSDLDAKADAADVEALRKEVAAAKADAKAASGASSTDAGASPEAVTALDGRIDQLEKDVEELRTAQQDAAATP